MPIHVRRMQEVIKNQNTTWFTGKKAFPRRVVGCVKGRVRRTKMAANIAITPPSLLGIDRKIA